MHIVCAVDGSEFSRWAINAIGALGHHSLASLTLLHVLDTRHLKQVGTPHVVTYRGAKRALEKAGEDLLRQSAHLAQVALSQSTIKPRTAVRTLLLQGDPASTVVRRAGREEHDLIVLGTRGLSDIKGFLLGSTSRKVALLAPCPVLVVKQPIKAANRILFAVDESKYSRRAAKFLRSGILPETATITICSAAETPLTELAARHLPKQQIKELREPVLERATRLVARIRDEFIKEGYTVTTEVELNHVVDTILKIATFNQTDLLVVGSRGLSPRERLHLGSVSESLLKYAPCSVLIVKGTRG